MAIIPLAAPITTRDGTLTKDSKLVNCYWEPNAKGGKTVVKRPGLTSTNNFGAAAIQGAVCVGLHCLIILNNTMWKLSGGGSVAIPVPGPASDRFDAINNSSPSVRTSVFKSVTALWQIDIALAVTKNVDPDYPAATVAGIALLDGTYYVMTSAGVIYGSDLENPMSWNALNFITVDSGLGNGVACYRHLNYVAAFCTNGIQFFYDAANAAPGSPLSPASNTVFTVGCASGLSVQTVGDMTMFISKDKGRGRSVSALSGLTIMNISNPFIDRILNRSTSSAIQSVYSFTIKIDGHNFYGLSFADLDLTLVYDTVTQDWAQWASTSGGSLHVFRAAYSIYYRFLDRDVFCDLTSGEVYSMLSTVYQDNSVQINSMIVTPPIDGNSMDRKQLSTLYLYGDVINTTIDISWSDDDYTTFNTPQTVSLNVVRKVLKRLGSFYRRSFQFLHIANTPLRLEGMEFPVNAAPDETGA